MNARPTERQARDIMEEEIAAVGGGYEDGLVRTDGPRHPANGLEWWFAGNVEQNGSITPRTIAFLRAYVRIGGALGLQAQGLLLTRGRVHMDKYIIRRLVQDGYLSYRQAPHAFFELTDAGRTLISRTS